MKMNKYVLGTVCVASVFASCTNEELIKTNDSEQSIDAKQVEVLLKAKYAEIADAESRMALQGTEYAWVEGDKVGACYVSKKGTEPSANVISSNYKFNLVEVPSEPTKTADFYATSLVYEGSYLFYHQYDGNMTSTEGSKFNVAFPVLQSVDPANINKSVADNNKFISPVISIAGIADEEKAEVPVQFVPLYSTLSVHIKNETGRNLTVNKVEIIGKNLTPDGVLDIDNLPYASNYDAIASKVGEMNTTKSLLKISSTTQNRSISAVIKGSNMAFNNDKECTVNVLLPTGEYNIGSNMGAAVTTSGSYGAAINKYIVYTNEGKFEIKAELGTDLKAEKSNVEFKNRSLWHANISLTGDPTVVSTFDINNIDDWNSAIAYARTQNLKVEFVLKQDLEIKELPTDIPVFVTSKYNKVLKIAKGANVSFVENSYFANIENAGTVNLTDNVRIKSITNTPSGIINVAAGENVIGKDVAFNLDQVADTNNKPGVEELYNRGILNVNGTVNATSDWENQFVASTYNGTINVAKDAKFVSTSFTNAATINVYGTLDVTNMLTNSKAINVFTETGKFVGADNKVTNNGTITLDAIKDVFRSSKDEQVDDSFISTGNGDVIVTVTPQDFNGTTVHPTIQEINAASMSGSWNATHIKNLKDQPWEVVKQIWNGVTVDMSSMNSVFKGNTAFDDIKTLDVNGDCKLTNSTVKDEYLILFGSTSNNCKINVKENAKLTVAKHVQIGKANSSYPAININKGILDNYGVVSGDITIEGKNSEFINNEGAVTYCATSDGVYSAIKMSKYATFTNKGEQKDVNATSINCSDNTCTITGKFTVQTNK